VHTSVTLYKGMQKVSTASAYCHKHWHTQHGWFQRRLIAEGISIKTDKTKSRGRAWVKESLHYIRMCVLLHN